MVPGLARLSVGQSHRELDAHHAAATAETLRVRLIPSGTRFFLGHTHAQISDGVKSGVFSGRSSGSDAQAADGSVTSGRTPLAIMPCQGTDGQLVASRLTHSRLGDNVVARNLRAIQSADQTAAVASGYEQGGVSVVEVNQDQLVIDGIVGRANVRRTSDGVVADAHGTTIGTILLDGDEQRFPNGDVLTIPGVARLQRHIVDRTANGISVTALRLTLLDGSGAVLNLGRANLTIRNSGL